MGSYRGFYEYFVLMVVIFIYRSIRIFWKSKETQFFPQQFELVENKRNKLSKWTETNRNKRVTHMTRILNIAQMCTRISTEKHNVN